VPLKNTISKPRYIPKYYHLLFCLKLRHISIFEIMLQLDLPKMQSTCHSPVTRELRLILWKKANIRCHYDLQIRFSYLQITNIWNRLPTKIVTAPMINCLKTWLHKHWKNQDTRHNRTDINIEIDLQVFHTARQSKKSNHPGFPISVPISTLCCVMARY